MESKKPHFNKGRIFTPEHKEKLRLAKLGKVGGHKGFSHSKETKEKIRQKVIQVVKRGEDCNFWKGGINTLSCIIRKCWKMRQWRSDVFERDNYTCQECGARSSSEKYVWIEAHHIISFSKLLKEFNVKSLEDALNCEQLWNISNGRTLCLNCHKKTDNYLGKGRWRI